MIIDTYQLYVKILVFSLFILSLYSSMALIAVIWLWLIIFLPVLFFNFIVFYPCIRNIYFDLRTKIGEINTSINKLDEKFKIGGNIIGYQSIKEKHIAIIFPSVSSKNYPVLYSEVLLLLNYYEKQDEKHRLYFCYRTEDFINIVKSQNVIGIHVFGHGRMDSLSFEDGTVMYREFKGIKPKEFVAQWHCNHGSKTETSLGYVIGKKYYVPYGMRTRFINAKDVKELINGKINWTINETL